LTAGSGPSTSDPASAPTSPHAPNIVMVLTDDLSMNLLQFMPNVQQLQHDGATFDRYYVTDSLCCPSRSSIFTGELPHDTGVFTNNGDDGGYGAFEANGDDTHTFAVQLHAAGYRTAFMGKYLNGYLDASAAPKNGHKATSKNATSTTASSGVTSTTATPSEATSTGTTATGDTSDDSTPTQADSSTSRTSAIDIADWPTPPGWDEWDAIGNGYSEYDYALDHDGTLVQHGHAASDYGVDVLAAQAKDFVGAATATTPFFLEVATFAPHAPSTPAPRDADKFPGLTAPRGPSYGKLPTNALPWLADIPPLTTKEQQTLDTDYRKRAQSVQAVDEMIGNLRTQLQAAGLADNTYFVFTSDNGFHLGEHNLRAGKQTAFDTDINVPLVVVGPGVTHNSHISQLAENTDLNPTFAELAGLRPAATVDGLSLAPLLHGQTPTTWRQAVLVEHHHPASKRDDPDAAPKASGNPPTYEAIRTTDAVYVEYAGGGVEHYDTATDPDELDNLATSSPTPLEQQLHHVLTAMSTCKGSAACLAAAQLPVVASPAPPTT
jgi:N-acetylglucosamine-6-sulfatase